MIRPALVLALAAALGGCQALSASRPRLQAAAPATDARRPVVDSTGLIAKAQGIAAKRCGYIPKARFLNRILRDEDIDTALDAATAVCEALEAVAPIPPVTAPASPKPRRWSVAAVRQWFSRRKPVVAGKPVEGEFVTR